ncbi:MAG TPA: nuclear transport factor 2 family protein [Terriglobales bacterium]|jgi:hypothetical protein
MKTHVILSFVVACMLPGLAWAQTSMSPLEQTLVDQEKSLLAAEQKKDVEAVTQTILPDFTTVAVDGRMYDRHDLLESLSYLNLEVMQYNFKVVPVTDTVAIVSYDAVVKSHVSEENPWPRYQHFSSVWVKEGEQWKLKFQQSTAARVED